MFQVPKPGTNKWRLIIDLRELNKWYKTLEMSYETLKHLRHVARAGDWFVSMDLADGYYALGIREEKRDFFARGEFRAPEEKLIALAKAARSLLGCAASDRRWLPARQLASFAGKALFVYLAIAPARVFLRELHCVLHATRQGWDGRVKMTNQLRRDLKWWTHVPPSQHNGRSTYKPMETAYLHADSSSYGWGAVLNNNNAYQARGFLYEDDRAHHITWKELRAVRHVVESFLPQLRGRLVLMHEDNTAVVAALTNLTSRSLVMMMEELRKLWHLLDIHDNSIRPRYIYSTANIWADRLSREPDDADWQLNPRISAYMQRLWGASWPFGCHAGMAAPPPSLRYGCAAYCRRFYGARPPPKFWIVSPLEPSAITWSVSATLSE
eukprot:jgi/Tetstr1/436940/TSEL_025712.t1